MIKRRLLRISSSSYGRALAIVTALLFSTFSSNAWADPPDINNDGVVNLLDISLISSCFGSDPTVNPFCALADADGDGSIGFGDFFAVIGSYGESGFDEDTTSPVLAITSPLDGATIAGDTVEVTGTLDDDTTRVVVNGVAATVSVGGDWVATGIPLVEGDNIITALGTDPAQNSASDEITITKGAGVPPEVAILSPDAGSLFAEPAVRVTGTVSSDTATVVVSGVPAVVTPGSPATFSADILLREGINQVTALATDGASSPGTATIELTLDTLPPQVTVETPRDGATLTSLQVDIAGLVNDIITGTTINADDCTVTVNGVEAQVSNRTWMVGNLLLQRGPNTLDVVAIDRAGNSREVSLQVDVQDQAGQRVILLAGNNQEAPGGEQLDSPLVVSLVDSGDNPVPGRPVTFEVSRGDGIVESFPNEGRRVTVNTDDNGIASVFFTLGARTGAANHRVIASSPGFVGEIEFCAMSVSNPAVRITTLMGNGQTGVAEQPLPSSFDALVTDNGGNPVEGVGVEFGVVAGGGNIGGLPSVIRTTDADGLVSVILTLGPQEGIDNNVVTASFAGLLEAPAAFTASGRVAGDTADTTVTGVVLDNQDVPIEGVTVHIEVPGVELNPVPMDITGPDGQFLITGAPVGAIRLFADGSTTSRPGTWPELEFDFVTVAGQENTVGSPIWLLPLSPNTVLVQDGGPSEDVMLTLDGIAGTELTVFANSVDCAGGATECELRWTQVRGERVPMAPPLGSSFMIAGTLQPAGTHFDPPASICIPNSDMPVGSQVEIFSFDHDLGEFVALGTATVTDDGSQVCSDPGFGIVKAGWHGCVPPPPPCTGVCSECPQPDNQCLMASLEGNACTGCSCVIEPKADGTGCDDEDACTVMDQCMGGSCTSEPAEIVSVEVVAGGETDGLVSAFDAAVNFSAVVDHNCPSLTYEWNFGDGETSDAAAPSHTYASEGEYTVSVTVTCVSEGVDCTGLSNTTTVKVVKADIVMSGLPEEGSPNEEDPGANVFWNNDDDDTNDTPDKDQTGNVPGEDDLVAATLTLTPASPGAGMAMLTATGGRIKVWTTATKGTEITLPKTWDLSSEALPATVHVEGIDPSDAMKDVGLELKFTGEDSSTHDDEVKITVIGINLTIHKPGVIDAAETEITEAEELTKGAQTFVNLDNDDDDDKWDTGTTDTDVAGEDEMVKLKMEIKPPGAAGNAVLTAYEGGGNVKLWKAATKNNMEYNSGTNIPLGDFSAAGELTYYAEGISHHTAQQATKFRLTWDQEAGRKDEVALTIIGMDTIVWVGKNNSVNDNNTLDADPNFPAGLGVTSLRVFPGKRDESAGAAVAPGATRDKVDVKATLTVAPVRDVKVYFRSLDVDDPTANDAPIDNDGPAGPSQDNRGSSPARAGKIVGSDASGVLAHTYPADDKEESFEFQTTKQPGDNFRIAASGDADAAADMRGKDELFSGGTATDGQRILSRHFAAPISDAEIRLPGNYATNTLTVWRNLYVERDSMGPVVTADNTVTGIATDFVGSGTAMTQLISAATNFNDGSKDLDDAPADNGRFERGTVKLGTGATQKTINTITGSGNNRLVFSAANVNGMSFMARDNDILSPKETISGTVSGIIKSGGEIVWNLNITAQSETPIDWPDFEGGGEISVGGGAFVPVSSALPLLADLASTTMDIPFSVIDDDNFYANVPDADTGTMITRYTPAYILPRFPADGNNTNVAFEASLPNQATQTARLIANRAINSSNDFWWVLVLGAYQAELTEDNDPNREGTYRAAAYPGTNGVLMFQEMIRDWIATTEVVGGIQIGGNNTDPAAAGRDTRGEEILNHEVGHLFGLSHNDGFRTVDDPNGGVMQPSCCPPDKPISGTRGASTFTETSLRNLRQRLRPAL